jgi:hypothetical protein
VGIVLHFSDEDHWSPVAVDINVRVAGEAQSGTDRWRPAFETVVIGADDSQTTHQSVIATADVA